MTNQALASEDLFAGIHGGHRQRHGGQQRSKGHFHARADAADRRHDVARTKGLMEAQRNVELRCQTEPESAVE